MHTVLVLGGYGNFGRIICRALADDPQIRLFIAGRNLESAQALATELGLPARRGQYLQAETTTLASDLRGLGVDTLIHAAGPFQGQDYRVARAAIEAGCHYIDLADARDYVLNIGQLNAAAQSAQVLVTSGASSVPALAAAVIDHFLPEFNSLEGVRHGIASGSQTPGIATLRAVLSYCGKPFKQFRNGFPHTVYGFQDLHRRRFALPVGNRWMGACDVPDVYLFPQRYSGLKNTAFYAGLGIPGTHLATWILSWLVRAGVILRLSNYAQPLHWLCTQLQGLGTGHSAMFVEMQGIGKNGAPLTRTWQLLATNQQGPHIPCGAAIALTRKLASGARLPHGATPCVGLLTLEDYLLTLNELELRQILS